MQVVERVERIYRIAQQENEFRRWVEFMNPLEGNTGANIQRSLSNDMMTVSAGKQCEILGAIAVYAQDRLGQ